MGQVGMAQIGLGKEYMLHFILNDFECIQGKIETWLIGFSEKSYVQIESVL